EARRILVSADLGAAGAGSEVRMTPPMLSSGEDDPPATMDTTRRRRLAIEPQGSVGGERPHQDTAAQGLGGRRLGRGRVGAGGAAGVGDTDLPRRGPGHVPELERLAVPEIVAWQGEALAEVGELDDEVALGVGRAQAAWDDGCAVRGRLADVVVAARVLEVPR